MSAAGSPNGAVHAFHRLGRRPGRVGRHQSERWVAMLSEWWVVMTRYAQPNTPNDNNHARTAYSLDQNPRDSRAKSRAGRRFACLAAL